MNFTQEQLLLMMLYSPGSRWGLAEALRAMRAQLAPDEAELAALTDSVLTKLEAMSDAAFDRLDLYRDF
ncbi:MAG: transposon-transfer assisting family protein [Oscillospiraceae bacterium]|nr:transposon-transfer assisting family protein [Oscillospiraceae bacterium]